MRAPTVRRRDLRRALAVAVLWAATGCAPDCSPPSGAVRPNVILVTIDTLRADHLGTYGNRTVTTPNLDRLGAEGVVFERAYAASHVTVPSHLSLLSSLPVVEHGIVDHASPLTRPIALLPTAFDAAGYRTGAFVSAIHLGPRRALGQLLEPVLDRFDVPRRASRPHHAADTNARLLDWVREGCAAPFFAWVHYWDPHMPYEPEDPYDRAYYDGDPFAPTHTSMRDVQLIWFAYELGGFRRHLARESGEVRALKRDLGVGSRQVKDLVLYPEQAVLYESDPTARAALRDRLKRLGARIRPHVPLRRDHAAWLTGVRDVQFPKAQYAGEVSYTDAQIGVLRAELEQLGVADRTILVVTADHGESLGEHGIWFEHLGLHDPVARVPLIVWAPGRVPAGRRRDLVGGIDVAPTILGLTGLPVVPGMRGRDLLRGAPPPVPVVTEAVRRAQITMIDGPWKLVRTEHDLVYTDAYARDRGTIELYDLDADPAEVRDLAGTNPARVAELTAQLDAWLDAHRPGAPTIAPAVRDDTMDDLRALGYVE